jgi:hypothetical protein
MQSATSSHMNQNEQDDDSPISHGTGVASKATGQFFGVAKEATLVSVKVVANSQEMITGLSMAYDDIISENRQRNSVVCMALEISRPEGYTRDQALASFYGRDVDRALSNLHSRGIPVVVSSGNNALRRPQLDAIPAVLERPGVPIILVGGADMRTGVRAPESQGENQVSVYAPYTCPVQKKNNRDWGEARGTSFGKSPIYFPRTLWVGKR